MAGDTLFQAGRELLDETPVCLSLQPSPKFYLLNWTACYHLFKSSRTDADSFTMQAHYSRVSFPRVSFTTASGCYSEGL